MLKYTLESNPLTERTDDYWARTHVIESLDKEAIIACMLKSGTLLTRTDILAVLNNFEEIIITKLIEGRAINLPLFNTSFSISGVFDSPSDSFDGNRHKLNINFSKGPLIRKAEQEVKLEKEIMPAQQPIIYEVRDLISGMANEVLTRNGIVEVYGHYLKLKGDDPGCGLWFINAEGEEHKADIIIDNKPVRVVAVIPSLEWSSCQIKVVTQYSGGGTLLKIPKSFLYPKPLRVEG